jgi:hypothetical protein
MQLRATLEGLAVPATIAAILAKDTLMAISGDRTVAKAAADALVVGRLIKPAKEVNGSGTVETRFRSLIEIKADGIIAAGNVVKLSSADGSGNQRAKKWVGQTDAAAGDKPETMFGVCWLGGADAATVEVLVY